MTRSVSNSRTAAFVGVHGLLLIAAALMLTPFVWLLCAAFKLNEDVVASTFLPLNPEGFLGVAWNRLTVIHFRTLLGSLGLGRAALISVFLSATTAALATLLCAAAGYALAKLQFRGRTWAAALVLAAVTIPGPLLLAPSYTVLYQISLLDSYWGLILPAAAPAFGVFLFRQAMTSSVPDQLLEAARIDGCSELRLFSLIALPLVRPMVGAFMLITFLGAWTNYIGPQIVLQTPAKFPLAVFIAQLKGTYYQDYGLLMAATLVSIIPVLGLFLLLQREFISGLTSGAVKG
ncbi:MAG: carbohydrate ABC transporter permease [bacterium]|jgi:multiple sugar transport system permease protein|nr:carbohydrate ABC transporter permease [Phycisphaerales bacterium]MCE2653293.1 carbohydrate ABC transporter permease [Planctomycetaceae bacterium]